MQRWVRMLLLWVILPVLFTGLTPTQAQGDLLRDGGFEGTYTSRGRSDLNIPQDWSIWVGESPHTQDWMNLPPVAFPANGPNPSPHGGAHSLNLNKGYATFTAAVYQQVSVPTGSNVMAAAWAYLRTCKIPTGYDSCTSTPDSNAFTRIGIDPNGGTNPFDSDVVWSANALPHETWLQMNVNATSTGGTVTLFLYATQQWPEQLNNVYWDDASLSVGGTGGIAAAQPGAPTPQPTASAAAAVPYVNAQGQRADGSIVHTVEAGDTLDSIAYAYGVTRADLLKLNNITDPRIIQVGQQIIVKGPKATEEVTAEATAQATSDSTEGATDEATSDSASTAAPTQVPTPATTPTTQPPAEVINAAPAPVISVASGTVVYPIDPSKQTASVCVTMFEDGNGNRIQDNGEDVLAGGSILLTSSGSPAGQHLTDTKPDPYCFDGLAANDYVIQAAAPTGYGLTTPNQLKVQAYPGAQINVVFGAAKGVATVAAPPADSAVVAEGTAESTSPAPVTGESTTLNSLRNNVGLLVFGAAIVVLVGGMAVTILVRRQ